MTCNDADALVARYADGELGGLERYALEKHLRGCAKCTAKNGEILALRARLRSEAPHFAAPPGLRERVRAAVMATPAATPDRPRLFREHWRWLGGGAFAGGAATVLAFVVGTAILDWRENRDLAVQAVETHVRAMLGQHLIEVASSDPHSVKPWLSARLDYSPPVLDLASDGFPLLGGRVDTLSQRPVATLVYRFRNHTIDVFVRPESSDAPPLRTVRGFNCAHAKSRGFDWLAVSDVGSDVLMAFIQRLAREAPAP